MPVQQPLPQQMDQRLVPGGQVTTSDADQYRNALGGMDQRLLPGGGSGFPAQPAKPSNAIADYYDYYRPSQQQPDDIIYYHDIARADGKLQARTRDGRTVLVDPPAPMNTSPLETYIDAAGNEIGPNWEPTGSSQQKGNKYAGLGVPQQSWSQVYGSAPGEPRSTREIQNEQYGTRITNSPEYRQYVAEMTAQGQIPMGPNEWHDSIASSGQMPNTMQSIVEPDAARRFAQSQVNQSGQFIGDAVNAIGSDTVAGLAKQGQDRIDAANQYYQDTRNLKNTEVADNTDYNFKTELANQRIDANNASMEAELERQRSGGGLKSNNTDLSGLYGSPIQKEVNARDAAVLNADANRMKAAREEYNAEQDRQFSNWRSSQNELRNRQEQPAGSNPDALGLKDGKQASLDIAGLTGQFNAIMKNGQSKGLKFKDFVQNKIDSGELNLSDDVVKLVAKNYGAFAEANADRATTFASRWGNPTAEMRDAASKRREDRQKASDEGMARRRETAMQQGQDRAAVANLIGKGYTPAQANAAVARDNQIGAYYNMASGLANAELQSRERIAEGRNKTDIYQTDAMIGDRAAQRKADADMMKWQQQQVSNKSFMDAYNSVPSNLSGDPYDPTTPAGQYAVNQYRLSQGMPPIDFTGKAKATPPEQRTPQQSTAMADKAIGSLKDTGWNQDNPTSMISAINHFQREGLSPRETLEAMGKISGKDYRIEADATDAMRTIDKMVSDKASELSRSTTGPKKSEMQHKAEAIRTYIPLLRELQQSSGMSPEQIAMIFLPSDSRGTAHTSLPAQQIKNIIIQGLPRTYEDYVKATTGHGPKASDTRRMVAISN